MKVAIYTLGCKVNQYETQALENELLSSGHELVTFSGKADCYVINTCTVTAVSDKKSRQAIRSAKAHGAIVAVCGCYAQTNPDEVKALGVDIVAGTGDRKAFVSLLEQAVSESGDTQLIVSVDNALKRHSFEVLERGARTDEGLSSRTRAMLKVQDGCQNFCSYCIIPYARGPVRSMPLEDAIRQARALSQSGYRELVLTGIEIASYGQDLEGGPTLIDLAEAIADIDRDMRIRLGSLEPRIIGDEFCRRLSKIENLCPQFHLSMQSGCDKTLKAMRRKYDSARYFESVRLLRQYFYNPAITTDLIVGFPSETDEDFLKTLEFIQKCQFSSMHIFQYSRRTGTPAANMDGQIKSAVKEQRAAQAAEIARKMKLNYLTSCVGKTAQVLVEKSESGASFDHSVSFGHAETYAAVRIDSFTESGTVLDVTVTGVDGEILTATAR